MIQPYQVQINQDLPYQPMYSSNYGLGWHYMLSTTYLTIFSMSSIRHALVERNGPN